MLDWWIVGPAPGATIGIAGFLIGVPSFNSEIGPLPVIWNLGIVGVLEGVSLGAMVGSAADYAGERDAPSLFALIGIAAIALPMGLLALLFWKN
jgi:hypothetical protein